MTISQKLARRIRTTSLALIPWAEPGGANAPGSIELGRPAWAGTMARGNRKGAVCGKVVISSTPVGRIGPTLGSGQTNRRQRNQKTFPDQLLPISPNNSNCIYQTVPKA